MPRFGAYILCGFGALILALAYYQWRRGEATRGWTRTMGRIVVSQVEELRGAEELGFPKYRPQVRYQYSVGGRAYEGEEIAVGSGAAPAAGDAAVAQREASRFPAGSEVVVFYDPASPRRAVLEPGVPRLVPLFVLGLAVLAAGFVFLARGAR